MNHIQRLLQRQSALERRVNLLSSEESGAIVAAGDVIAAMQGLPGLRGLWPMSAFDSAGNAQDLSGHGHHLTYNGNPVYGYDGLAPYIELDGTGDYLSRTDEPDLDITGAESYVASPGLTLGGWYRFGAAPASMALMGKIAPPSDQSYHLYITSDSHPTIYIYPDGSTSVAAHASAAIGAGWHFILGRFTPSTELSVYQSGVWHREITGIPASTHAGVASLTIGAYAGGFAPLTGRASLCFLCASALSDAMITALWERGRLLFGV